MRDEGLMVEPGLSAHEEAVSYILQRIRVDANLRYYLVGSEAWAKLCIAEAQRTGEDVEKVRRRTAEMLPHCRNDVPEVHKLRQDIERIERTTSLDADCFEMAKEDAMADVQHVVRDALDLCPACAGLPHTSINRCEMCRKLVGVI